MAGEQILAISNFAKYIPIDLSGFKGIFECEIKSHANILIMQISLYQIRNLSLFENVAEGLNKNPESKNLADAIDKELIFQEDVSQIDSISVKHGFQQKLNDYSSVKPDNTLQLGDYVTLHGIIPNLNNLYLQYEHAYIVYSFFKFFIDSYDTIKLSFRHFKGNETQTVDEQVEEQIDEQVEEQSSVVMGGDDSGIFLEMMGIVSSRAMRAFITRNIFNKNWNLDTAVLIDNTNSKLIIKHHPLYDFNIWQYSLIHNNELTNILSSIPEQNTFELANKLKQIVKQLIYIIFNSKILKKQDNSKYIFTIITGLFLLYIYSLKMMSGYFIDKVYTASTRNSADYVKVVNYAFKYVLGKFNVNANSKVDEIIVEYSHPDANDDASMFDPVNEKLDMIFEQYKYLSAIDQNEFLGSVFSKLSTDLKTPTTTDASTIAPDLELSFGNPTLVNINSFISPKQFAKNELTPDSIFAQNSGSLLDYVDIPLNDIFKSKRIISYYYCQILFIQYNAINRKLLELPTYSSPVIRRYSDVIINGIFKEIDNQEFLAMNTASSFQIYRHFIAPFIGNEAITEYTSLVLLYQIAIPHLCNVYGVNEFIDNFH